MIVLAAAILRLWKIQSVLGNPFYDAAVRSMGHSWHAFFFGALEPGGSISIDKPPIDLWLQVASTKLLGYSLLGLHLPEALSGVAACALLFGALRRPYGEGVAAVAAIVLALLPISILTARSDTMDSLLAMLQIAALWCSWRALSSGRLRWSVAAALIMGVAFNVKLSESLIALPALLLTWLWAAGPGRRVRVLLSTAATFVVASLAWVTVASLTAASHRPYPIGSATGSLWRVIFLFNGLDRISGHGAIGASSRAAPPGLTRLMSTGSSRYGAMIGVVLLATLLLGALALVSAQLAGSLRDALRRPAGRLTAALCVWFGCALVMFSAMRRLEPRYLEALAPAMCALLALAVVRLIAERRHWVNLAVAASAVVLGAYTLELQGAPGGWALISLAALAVAFALALLRALRPGARHGWALIACLAVWLCAVVVPTDIEEIRGLRSDSSFADASTPALSRYLRSHRDGARYELASASVMDASGIVARDGLPVMVLDDVTGEVTHVGALKRAVAGGAVRFYFTPHGCHSGVHCPYNERWAYAHSVPVGHLRGLRRFRAPFRAA